MNKPFSFTLLLVLFLFVAYASQAQDDDVDPDPDNLVPNGSFEKFEGSLRRGGQFDLTTDWGMASEIIPDLYASNIRSSYVLIPENMMGYEEPADGDNYAGIVAYSYRSKMKRSYISVELKEKLDEDELVCIKFKASLAERSLYASNNLGVNLSKGRLFERTEGSVKGDNVQELARNPIVNQTDGWWEFCRRYAARGGEKFLTIGNFQSDNNTSTETLEIPEKYAEAGPEMVAYYYIDAVEVRRIEANGDCGCENTKIPESKVIYSSSVQIKDDATLQEKIEGTDVYFYQYKSEVVSNAKRSIDQIIGYMNANPAMKISIIGHEDADETKLAATESSLKGLDEQRAMNVLKYMVTQGIDRSRLSISGKGSREPVSTMTTPLSLAKNRRVEFKISL
jgi:outer membrane protein OmpA-like peptidoglycan-associated protein